jgi:transcription elongation GreA/GreB family factor
MSPVGRALLGRRAGDEVEVRTPGGVRRLTMIEATDSGLTPE